MLDLSHYRTDKFIVLEGLEGAGKSTVLSQLKHCFQQHFNPSEYLFTREPGGSIIAEKIRALILESSVDEPLCDESELLLLYASRMQHLKARILPMLSNNEWVVCDRFYLSTFAYQGGGRQTSMQLIKRIHQDLLSQFKPGFTIYLDIEPEIGIKRIQSRGQPDRIESEQMAFFHRAREVYLKYIKEETNYLIIDASKPLSYVVKQVNNAVENYIIENK